MKSEHHIRTPFPDPRPPRDALYKYKFQKPASIRLIGSYALKATCKSAEGFIVDLAIMMPDVSASSIQFSS